MAYTAGLDYATGDAVIVIDGDLQPEPNGALLLSMELEKLVRLPVLPHQARPAGIFSNPITGHLHQHRSHRVLGHAQGGHRAFDSQFF